MNNIINSPFTHEYILISVLILCFNTKYLDKKEVPTYT